MQLPFYFDYACPWAWLGSTRVERYFSDLGDRGVEVDYRPVHLATLREPASGPAPKPGERKRRYYRADLLAWCEMVGVELSPDAGAVRPDTRLLLCAALVAKDAGRIRAFQPLAYAARWAEARDVADAEVVHELLGRAGLDADRALEQAASETLRARLDADTRAAIERGVFGVPTIFVGERMFWGNDRFELVRHFLQKQQAPA